MIKAIFFDYDGVIVESVDVKTRAFGELFMDDGADISKKVVAYHVANTGVSRYDKFRHIYKEMLHKELSDKKFEELCARFSALVKENVIRAPYVEGAREFLERESGKYECYVTSATPFEELREIIEKRNEADFFKTVYGAPTNKKEAIKEALQKEGIKASEAIYIGDAMSDYNAARENKINFIARVYSNDSIFQGIDCIKIGDLKTLASVIQRL